MPHPGRVTATPDPTPTNDERTRTALMPPPTGRPVIVDDERPPTVETRLRLAPALWGVLAVLVVAAGLFAADWAIRSYEMSMLLNRIEASESAMVQTQEQMGALRLPEDPSQAQRDRAAEVLKSIAEAGREGVSSAGAEVAGASFLPWHGSLVDAQGAYLAHNQAWVDHLERGSTDVTALLSQDSEIEATWVNAERQVRAAMPSPAWAPLSERVERIFTDPPADEPSENGIPT